MDNEQKREALKAAFEAANYRPPTPQEAKRIDDSVITRGKPGPKPKEKK